MERKGSKNWEKLNTYQQEAVLDESPACVVNANVGSGKTTVLMPRSCTSTGRRRYLWRICWC